MTCFRYWPIFVGLSAICNSPISMAATPDEVLKGVDAVRSPGDNYTFDLSIKEQKTDGEKISSFTVNVKDNEKSLVTYTAPETSKGKRLLMVGENLWIYVPNTRMPVRISPQQKVSSGVSNADVARVVYSLDYQADDLKEEVLDNLKTYRIALKAKTKGAAYQHIDLWAAADDYRPLKADFYTLSEQKLKTIQYKDYQSVLGKARPMLLEVTDGINASEKAFLQYSHMVIADTPDSNFQSSYLSRLP